MDRDMITETTWPTQLQGEDLQGILVIGLRIRIDDLPFRNSGNEDEFRRTDIC